MGPIRDTDRPLMFGMFPKDVEDTEPEPVTERFACTHKKVYPTKAESPYPWICSLCGDKGEDKHFPVCDNMLFWELMRNGPSGLSDVKTTPCYYCGSVVLARGFSEGPPKCGKCT